VQLSRKPGEKTGGKAEARQGQSGAGSLAAVGVCFPFVSPGVMMVEGETDME